MPVMFDNVCVLPIKILMCPKSFAMFYINGQLGLINGQLDLINGQLDLINGQLELKNGNLQLNEPDMAYKFSNVLRK